MAKPTNTRTPNTAKGREPPFWVSPKKGSLDPSISSYHRTLHQYDDVCFCDIPGIYVGITPELNFDVKSKCGPFNLPRTWGFIGKKMFWTIIDPVMKTLLCGPHGHIFWKPAYILLLFVSSLCLNMRCIYMRACMLLRFFWIHEKQLKLISLR